MLEEQEKENQEEDNAGKKEEVEINVLGQCQKERDEYLDGWKRAKADLLNYKKEETKRFEAVVKFSNESLIKELIGVLDSFDLALTALENEKEHKIQKGLYLIKSQMEDILKKNGLERVIVPVGQQFNPAFHLAIASVDSDKTSGTITEEIEGGYLLNGKLIRPARVKVSK